MTLAEAKVQKHTALGFDSICFCWYLEYRVRIPHDCAHSVVSRLLYFLALRSTEFRWAGDETYKNRPPYSCLCGAKVNIEHMVRDRTKWSICQASSLTLRNPSNDGV